jgi:hypothetical protein
VPFFGAFLQGLIAWYAAHVGVGRLQMPAMCTHVSVRAALCITFLQRHQKKAPLYAFFGAPKESL